MKSPPRIARWILSVTNRKTNREIILGDFEELFEGICSGRGAIHAAAWYYMQAFKSVPKFLYTSTYWGAIMFNNYLKIALRNILRHKGYSFINIAGLSLGMACAVFLLLWVHNQQSFDNFHENSENLYRVEQDQKSPQGKYRIPVTPFPAGPEIKESIPEIKNSSRSYTLGRTLVKFGEKSIYEKGVFGVDPSFMTMFTFPMLSGSIETALDNPYSIILSEHIATKYFGNEDPLGKSLILNSEFPFTVTGVMENPPENSSLKPSMLIPFVTLIEFAGVPDNWGTHYVKTWIELYDSNVSVANKKITELVTERSIGVGFAGETAEEIKDYRENRASEYVLMPLTDINIYGYYAYGKIYGSIRSIKIFLTLAFFILLIASINYMNLSTARVANRVKEIGMRKVIGAGRKNIMGQFFGESILYAIISFFLSLLLVIILLPLFNELTGDNFSMNSIFGSEFFIILVIITLLTGILSGSYPALFLSSISPIKIFKGNVKSGSASNFFRKSLVIFQFCLSVILIIGTIIAFKQLEFMRTKNVGYNKDRLISIPLRGETKNSYTQLKHELLRSPNIVNVSGIDQHPTNIENTCNSAEWEGKDPNIPSIITFAMVDYDFVETLEIEMIEGRSFSNLISTDSESAILINEEVFKLMGKESCTGQYLNTCGFDGNIIGVMKNFNYHSAQTNIEPLAIIFYDVPNYAIVKLRGGRIPEAIEKIKSVWQNVSSQYPFEYTFVDDDFAKLYKSDEQMRDIFKYAAVLAIVIACLGLFGFASFMAEKRFKEIGIRKTLGSSVSQIIILLNKEFLKWIIIANLLAWPAGFMIMEQWLQDFAYRIDISVEIFIISTVISLVIALFTVSYQSVKAANANPVESLRVE